MRDYRELLKEEKFWDLSAERMLDRSKSPPVDAILQNREEIIALCQWIEMNNIRSYLEIGIWTGRLISALHRLFSFKSAACCDIGSAKFAGLSIELPKGVSFFEGNSRSPIYLNWRRKLGAVDLTFIDASHSFEDVKQDFEINMSFPHRFIALHGIAGSSLTGDEVKRFWAKLEGKKHEILLPHPEINSEKPTMGIGIWEKS